MVFRDTDQTEAAIESSIAAIKSDSMREYVQLERKEKYLGMRTLVARAVNDDPDAGREPALPTILGAQVMFAYAHIFNSLETRELRETFVSLMNAFRHMDPNDESITFQAPDSIASPVAETTDITTAAGKIAEVGTVSAIKNPKMGIAVKKTNVGPAVKLASSTRSSLNKTKTKKRSAEAANLDKATKM